MKECGYGNGRGAGGLGPTPGAPNAESLPPTDWLATNSYAPAELTLANMKSLVTNAYEKGGGWSQIVLGRVCDATLDAANYASCSASWSHVELADLNVFLDWVAAAGQAGGAPAGVSLDTVNQVALTADTSTPVSTITCNAGPCEGIVFKGQQVSVALAATDIGSGLGVTRYTTDGTDPTASSTAYSARLSLTASSTVKYRTWDRAGNIEPVRSQFVNIQPGPESVPPTTALVCNENACSANPYTGTVRLSFTAVDNLGGWGVDKTYYTTNGTTPTTASAVYTAPFEVSVSSTVKFFSTDLAGNAEAFKEQLVSVNNVATNVSLTWDDGTLSQYTLAHVRALAPHGVHSTYYLNTGGINDGDEDIVTWAQVAQLNAAGHDIGGHTVNHTNLTDSTLSLQDKINAVCNDRTALTARGYAARSFAYPEGA